MNYVQEDLVSIIMSVYNEKRQWLVDCIESLINQTYRNLEIIIVIDNPNNHELIEVVNDYKSKDQRIKVIINKENMGLVKSLNKALNFSSGVYIARMDADDICFNHRIEYQIEYLVENQLDLCASYYIVIDEHNNNISRFNTDIIEDRQLKKIQQTSNFLAHPTWLFKKDILEKIKGYKDIPAAEDYDFTCRLILSGFTIGIIPEYLIQYRVRSNSISNSNILHQRRVFNIVRSCFRKSMKSGCEYNPEKYISHVCVSKQLKKNYEKSKKAYTKCKYYMKHRNIIKAIFYLLLSIIKCPISYKLTLKDKFYVLRNKF